MVVVKDVGFIVSDGLLLSLLILLQQNKKRREQWKKCHARTMMHNEACEVYKMNTHHVPFSRQSVEGIRPGKT